MTDKYPRYLNLLESGELKNRAEKLKENYKRCTLCPWDCRIDRTGGRLGVCKSTDKLKVASSTPHFGEEPMLVGAKGSGTIFFSNCVLRCKYCQNYQISHEGSGDEISDEQLADMMIGLQKKGCHNINLVSPTHFIPNILNALIIAAGKGLNIPLVYNTHGYEKAEILEFLDGVIDIYLPDIKYTNNDIAVKLSNAPKYVEYNKAALKEMYRQVGNLALNDSGVAKKGLIIRHLILPNDMAGSKKAYNFLVNEISKDIFIGVMSQYKPCFKAIEDPMLNRTLLPDEYHRAVRWAKEAGLHNILTQELGSSEVYLPDFKKEEPFGN
ncbi:radical SAM protein [Candidatus Margulisiibacteriota bacterium]